MQTNAKRFLHVEKSAYFSTCETGKGILNQQESCGSSRRSRIPKMKDVKTESSRPVALPPDKLMLEVNPLFAVWKDYPFDFASRPVKHRLLLRTVRIDTFMVAIEAGLTRSVPRSLYRKYWKKTPQELAALATEKAEIEGWSIEPINITQRLYEHRIQDLLDSLGVPKEKQTADIISEIEKRHTHLPFMSSGPVGNTLRLVYNTAKTALLQKNTLAEFLLSVPFLDPTPPIGAPAKRRTLAINVKEARLKDSQLSWRKAAERFCRCGKELHDFACRERIRQQVHTLETFLQKYQLMEVQPSDDFPKQSGLVKT